MTAVTMLGILSWPFAGTWQLSQQAQQEYILSSWTFPELEATPLTGVVVAVLLFSFLLEILWHGASVTSSSCFPCFPQEFHPLGIPVRLCRRCLDLNPSSLHPPRAPSVLQNGTLRSPVYHPYFTFPASPDTHVIPQPQLFFQLSHKIFSLQLGINGHRAAQCGGQHTSQPGISLFAFLQRTSWSSSNTHIKPANTLGASQYLLSGTQASNILATSSHTELDGQLEISPWRPLSWDPFQNQLLVPNLGSLQNLKLVPNVEGKGRLRQTPPEW